jgi:hypothetical protein
MASGALRDYFGRGLASARPAAPDLYDDVLGFWFATDTGILSAWNGAAWEDVASVDPIVAAPPSGGWSNGAMLIYSATLGAFVEIPPGSPGQVMTFQTGDTADWEDPTGGGAVSSVNGQTGAVVLSLFDLSDVLPNTGTPEDGDVLTWDAAQGAWVASPAVGGVASVNGQTGVVSLSLEDLDDVMTGTGTPDIGDTLVWDGSQWVAQPGGGGAVSSVNGQTGAVLLGLEDLVDVLPGTGAPDDGDVLRYSTADDAWRAEPLPGSSGGGTIGKHMLPIMASAMFPRSTTPCGTLTTDGGAADQPDIHYLPFDASATEYAVFSMAMPESWNEGTVTFKAIWKHPATTTNFGVVWQLQAVAVSDDDALAVNFGTAQSSADTGGTTADHYVSPESSAITVAGSPAAGDTVYFRINRLPSDGSDTLAVDAHLIGIRLYYTKAAELDT